MLLSSPKEHGLFISTRPLIAVRHAPSARSPFFIAANLAPFSPHTLPPLPLPWFATGTPLPPSPPF